MNSKWIGKSKTMWLNVGLVAIAYFLFGSSEIPNALAIGNIYIPNVVTIDGFTIDVPMVMAVVNIFIRWIGTNTGLDEKHWLRSKTVGSNLAMAIFFAIVVYTTTGDLLLVGFVVAIGVANILVRKHFTDKGVHLLPSLV